MDIYAKSKKLLTDMQLSAPINNLKIEEIYFVGIGHAISKYKEGEYVIAANGRVVSETKPMVQKSVIAARLLISAGREKVPFRVKILMVVILFLPVKAFQKIAAHFFSENHI